MIAKIVEKQTAYGVLAEVSLTPSEQVDRQIKGYLEKPCIDYESDHLQCWYSHKDEFPVIATLAKRCLCVCGTSVSFECLFGKV